MNEVVKNAVTRSRLTIAANLNDATGALARAVIKQRILQEYVRDLTAQLEGVDEFLGDELVDKPEQKNLGEWIEELDGTLSLDVALWRP